MTEEKELLLRSLGFLSNALVGCVSSWFFSSRGVLLSS